MAMRCDICGKRRVIGRKVSHSGVKTRRIFKPNIHTAWVIKNGRRIRMRLCTKCLRRIRKEQKEKPAPKSVSPRDNLPETASK